MTFSPDMITLLTPTLSPSKTKQRDINDTCNFKTTKRHHLKSHLSSKIINIRFEEGINALYQSIKIISTKHLQTLTYKALQ